MIELIFGESPAGALKIAKSMKRDDRIDYVTMTGGPQDVAPLTLALDIGTLTDMDTEINARATLLYNLYNDYADVAKELLRNNHTLDRLREAKNSHEKVRVWVCAGDQWLLLRLRAMLEAGELIEVSPPKDDRRYSGVMKKTLILGRQSK